MSTLYVAAILVASVVALVWIFIKFNARKTRREEQAFFDHFNRIASENNIKYTKHEKFSNKIIGLDQLKKTLVIFEFEHQDNPILINLSDLRSCTLVKEYGHINTGNETKPKLERYTQSIDLVFTFKNKSESIIVTLYENHMNGIDQMLSLEASGKEWETIISQSIPSYNRQLA
jgi:hypothetical protein